MQARILSALLLFSSQFARGHTMIDQLYDGQLFNQPIYSSNYGSPGNCAPNSDVTIGFEPEFFPFATGVDLYLKFDNVNVPNGQLLINNLPVVSGDSLLLGSFNSGYTLCFTNSGGVDYSIMASGVPEVVNENYACWIDAIMTLSDCFNAISLYAGESLIPCSVATATSISEHKLVQNIFFSQDNRVLSVETENSDELVITDVLGKVILSQSLEKGKHVIALPQVSKGIYFATLQTDTKTLKFIIH